MARQKITLPNGTGMKILSISGTLLFLICFIASVSGVDFSVTIIDEDTEPPLVTNPTALPPAIAANGVQESQLSVNAIDQNGISSVLVDLSSIGGPGAKRLDNIDGTSTYVTTAVAALGTPPGAYALPVNATDASPNQNSNTSVNILLSVTEPQVIIYDFARNASIDRWAYRLQCNAHPPATPYDPTQEFSSSQYTMIRREEGLLHQDSSSRRGYYAAHRFQFTITGARAEITRLHVLWTGRGSHQFGMNGATLYIWNYRTNAYELIARSTSSGSSTLERTVTDNVTDYIDSNGTLMLLAEQNSAQWQFWRWIFRSNLGTDYVQIGIVL